MFFGKCNNKSVKKRHQINESNTPHNFNIRYTKIQNGGRLAHCQNTLVKMF